MINELNNKCIELDNAVHLMGSYGKAFAEAEREYYKAKAEETLRLQSEGVPATTITNVVKGHVCDKLYKMEFAKTMYETSKENINRLKLQIKVLDNQVQMEWSQAGRE